MMKATKSNKRPLELNEAQLLRELQGLRKIHVEAASLARGTGYISDELLADRRAEVVKEAEETLRCLRERKRKR